MINPLRACLWSSWLCYPQQTCSYFGNSQLSRVASSMMCLLCSVGVVKHLRRITYWSLDAGILSRCEDKKLCLRSEWQDRGRNANKGSACAGSQRGEDLRLASNCCEYGLSLLLHSSSFLNLSQIKYGRKNLKRGEEIWWGLPEWLLRETTKICGCFMRKRCHTTGFGEFCLVLSLTTWNKIFFASSHETIVTVWFI